MDEAPKFTYDLEGTLVDLENIHQVAWKETAEKLGLVFGAEQFRDFIGAGDKAISKEISRLSLENGREVAAEGVRRLKFNLYKDMLYGTPIQPREGVAEYLERSRILGGKLVIASLTPKEFAHLIIEKSGLRSFFHYILTEEDVKNLKPKPDVYLKARDLHGIEDASKMLVHEDSPPGVKAGKAAGAKVAAFPVHQNLHFDPQPDQFYLSWVGLDPKQIYEELTRAD